ncbi:uncharacterized protein EI90DRAFT_3020567 [Cantharellus anzutake]|uniref:uncharacterized protein n=1 Tax=Cantharellus anzutake TaxID=1750568 RepID=UPI00190886F8|nr:uncharacterized protein EI90DRAFT_3020567 [Cantharellus anzutake]KAF8320225.1 hypothetical protein EI90DRAFT_3020567 [Cantharellus anzutake]
MTGPLRAQMQMPSGPNLPNARSPEDDISPLTFYESLQRDRKKDPSYRCPEPILDMAQPSIWQSATNTIPPESPTSIQTCQGKALVEEREKRLKHLKSIQQALAQDEHRALQDLKDVLLKNEEDEVHNIPTISQG